MVLTKNGVPFQFFRRVRVATSSTTPVFEARFHEWGLEADQYGGGSCAIVEKDDGTIITVPPWWITFTGATETVSI